MPGAYLWGWYPTTSEWKKLKVDVDGSIHVVGYVDSLDDIGDVNVAAPADGESLVWDAAAGEWVAEAVVAGSQVFWKDVSVQVVADLNRTVTLDWTDLDLTASTSAAAKFAIVRVVNKCDSWVSGDVTLALRKNGTTPTHYPMWWARTFAVNYFCGGVLIIGLDAGQVLEYQIVVAITAQVDSYIEVLGYIE